MRADSNILVTAGLLWLGISIILGAVLLQGGQAQAEDGRMVLECVVIDPTPYPSSLMERGEETEEADRASPVPTDTPNPLMTSPPTPLPATERGEEMATMAGIFQTATAVAAGMWEVPPTPLPIEGKYVIAPRGVTKRPCPRVSAECPAKEILTWGTEVLLNGNRLERDGIVWVQMYDQYWLAESKNGEMFLGDF